MTIASATGEGKEVGEEGKEEVRRKKVKRERSTRCKKREEHEVVKERGIDV